MLRIFNYSILDMFDFFYFVHSKKQLSNSTTQKTKSEEEESTHEDEQSQETEQESVFSLTPPSTRSQPRNQED